MTSFWDLLFPYSIWSCLWLSPTALCLDLVFGDPALPWRHPVCIIGAFLNWLEPKCRKWSAVANQAKTGAREKNTGYLAVIATASLTAATVWILIAIPCIGFILAIYFAWAGLAGGCLLNTGKDVISTLESGDTEKGRQAVGWLVSRDISQLSLPMLRKTLADTLSENFTDAFMAPWFWLLIAGPVGLWIYKAVSTMDSQWGYKTEKWLNLGRGAAKADDFMAWLPARFSALTLFCANYLLKLIRRPTLWQGRWPGFKVIKKEAKGMPSPNSGWPMAACAWLCNGSMAGPAIYFGQLVPKEWLGPPNNSDWPPEKLRALCRLMLAGFITGALLLWLCAASLRFLLTLL